MSGSTRAITLSLSVKDAGLIQEQLKSLGTVGEESLRRLEAAAAKAASKTTGVGTITTATTEATTSVGGFNTKLQSAGYQMQDFAVQVQGGTSALTALSQQGSQFLGAFGTTGAIAGAVLTVGILAMKLLDTAASVESIVKANEHWATSQTAINNLLDTAIEKAQRLSRAHRDAATIPLRATMGQADREREVAGQEIPDLEKQLRELTEGRTPAGLAASARPIRELQTRLASARDDAATATRIAVDARAQIDRIEALGPAGMAGQEMVANSTRDVANGRTMAGMTPPRRAIAQAGYAAEEAADKALLVGEDRRLYIANKITEAEQAQQYALDQIAKSQGKATEAAEARLAAQMRPGDTEILRAREQLELQKQLAAAESPRAAMLVQFADATDRATQSLRVRIEAERDPALAAALQKQVDLIKAARTETEAWAEAAKNNSAIQQQGATMARQAFDRQALGMSPTERARATGEFDERQRLGAADQTTPEAMQRIRNAGDIAVTDEGLQRMKDFTAAGQQMGSSFSDAFSAMAFSGKKFSDVLSGLQRQLASSIMKATVGKYLEQAVGMGANYAGNYASNVYNNVNPNVYSAPIGPTISGAPMADGGIMTGAGPVPLRKYARGGVANSPQMAIFGEASMAEAFVPLPDGRSIPVKMKGGGGGAVYNIDARGADAGVEHRIRAVLAAQVPGIIAASRQDLVGRVNSGGSLAHTFGRR